MSTAEKVDLTKQHKSEYVTPRKPVLIKVKKAKYLAVSGQGAPGGDDFQARIGALYGAAFTIKMTRKFAGKGDYVISKLEGQYWCDKGTDDFGQAPPERMQWRLLIRTPDFITKRDLKDAVKKLLEKGKAPEAGRVELITLSEGACVQMLHVGPYDREKETIAKMLAFTDAEGQEVHGLHHEIYLSDPRRVPPERLRTILRLPVRKKKRR